MKMRYRLLATISVILLAGLMITGPAQASAKYDLFQEKFAEFNKNTAKVFGGPLFSRAEEGSPGVVAVKTTKMWVKATPKMSMSSVDALFKIWKAVLGGAQVTMIVIDPDEQAVLAMWDTPDGGVRVTRFER